MGLIKLIIKLLVLPLIVAVTLIQWVGIFFTQFSTVIFNLQSRYHQICDRQCPAEVRKCRCD